MKKLLSIVLALVLLTAFAACNKTVEVDENTFSDGDQYEQIGGELNILNWGEYIDPELIELFEQETGVKVNYIELTSNEEIAQVLDEYFNIGTPELDEHFLGK